MLGRAAMGRHWDCRGEPGERDGRKLGTEEKRRAGSVGVTQTAHTDSLKAVTPSSVA